MIVYGMNEKELSAEIMLDLENAILYSPSFVLKCQQVKQNNCCC